jgi:hypothetical protein
MNPSIFTNIDIAGVLERLADLLEAQAADKFRVDAYRRAARQVAAREDDLAEQAVSGADRQLEDLPGIGRRIAAVIREFVNHGRVGLLERLEGGLAPENLFRSVPNIGPTLARRIHARLGIETLEELEMAAHEGELEQVPGIGVRRSRAIRDSVGALLNRSGRRRARRRRLHAGEASRAEAEAAEEPGVALILEADAEYRRKACAGRLKTIAPRRFNPEGKSWLPILHTQKDGWDLTALYSNTARAHDLGRVRDWVVIYADRDGVEARSTVVTETGGPLAGKRVVRGRENECRRHYAGRNSPANGDADGK